MSGASATNGFVTLSTRNCWKWSELTCASPAAASSNASRVRMVSGSSTLRKCSYHLFPGSCRVASRKGRFAAR